MQVTLNIPDFTPLTLNNDMKELKRTIKLNSALMLFKNAKLSIEQASDFAGIGLYDFMAECSDNHISVISYDEEELTNELQMMKTL